MILADCLLRLIDFASIDNLWEPGFKLFMAAGQPGAQQPLIPEVFPTLLEALKGVPRAIMPIS